MKDGKKAKQQRRKKLAVLPQEIAAWKASEKDCCKRVEERIAKLNCLKEQLTGKRKLNEKLKLITDGVVEILGADFARVWITKEGDLCTQGCGHALVTEGPEVCRDRTRCLHLMASSGRYTRMDGRHHRLPLIGDKIGLVASGEDCKIITNDVIHDPRIHDHGWARRIGLVSFAGYRLFSGEGKPVGVLALFSKLAIVPDEMILLENLSYITSQIIQSEITEEALRRSEERFRLISESLPMAVFEMDTAGRCIYTNKKWQDIFHVTLTESFSVHWNQWCHGEEREEVGKEWSAAMRNLKGFSKECRIHTPDGEVRWIHFRSSPIISDRGVRYTGTVEDITDRKQTEEARRRSEEEAKRVALENATMAEIGRILSSTLNIQEVYESFAEAVRKLIPFDRISITIINPQSRAFMISYAAGLDAAGRKEGDVIPLAGTAAEEVIRTHSSMLIGSLEESASRFPRLLPLLEAGFQAIMLVPLISRDRVIGILNLELAKPPIYTAQDLKLAENVGNQIAGAIANAQLFVERDRALETLREREERFRSILETMEEGYFEVDLKGRFTFFNDSLRKMMGFSKDELMGMSNREYMDEKTARRIFGIFNQIYKSGQPGKVFEWEIMRRDGTSSLHESSVYLIRNATGERIGFRGLIREVTERKKMEEALLRSEKAAQRLARENAIIAEIGRIFCSTLNIEDVYERFAEEVRKLIPFERIEINAKKFGEDAVIGIYRAGLEVPDRQAGKSFSLAGTITGEVLRTSSSLLISADTPEDSLKRFPGYLPAYQAGLQSLIAVPLISRDEAIGVLVISSLQRNAYKEDDLRLAEKVATQIAGAIANAQLYAGLKRAEEDLRQTQGILETRVKERTEELVKARDTAEAANRAKSDFLANMSHELRTPLNHILGFTELVVDRQCGELNEEQEEYLNDVLQSSRHLLSLINDILDLSKVEAGKLELQVQEIYLRKLLEGSLGMVKEKAMKHGIRLLTDIDGIPEEIQADERKLKQIIFNLLSNSVKFTPDGGSVTLSARYLSFRDGHWRTQDGESVDLVLDGDDRLRKGGLIDISVQDTGIGIRREDLERIFDPFEQGDNSSSRRYQGTGLGLSLSRKLVELHGGKIWATSEGEGKGSIFNFVIPF